MRPKRLEVEGFGTFRERTEIDFGALDLVAFVGPTGSGKSTVIDAMTFALYGSVARYDNTSLVAPVIHQLATEAKVRFDFELAGRGYTAVRVVRRVKATAAGAPRATTREARLERSEGDGATTVLAGNVSELDDEIATLIGLDFHQFTRTIVLPQGDFAEFLTDDPGNRQKLLRRLLDLDIYARMGARARDLAREAGQRVEIHTEELERLSATPERLGQAEARVAALDAFIATLDDRLLEVATVDTELAERRDDVTALDEALARLSKIEVPDGLVTADAVTATALAALADARRALTEAETGREKALDALSAAGDPQVLRAAVGRRRRHEELTAAVAELRAEHDDAAAAEADATREATEATEAADAADRRVRLARRSADAAEWVAQLVEGEPCPICAQVVGSVPEVHGAGELRALEEAADAAGGALRRAQRSAATAAGRVKALAADLERKGDELAVVTGESTDDDATVTPETLAAAYAAAAAADAAGVTLRHAETTVRSAQAELDDARKAEATHRSGFMGQRDAVVALGAPAPEGSSLVDDWQELAAWAGAEAAQRQEQRATIAARGKELAATKSTLLDALAAEADALGLDGTPSAVRPSAAASRAGAEGEVTRLADELARADDLRARITEASEAKVVHDALGRQHLSAAGFERWLLAEALDHLVDRATGRLLELSNGRYSLEAVDGNFAVRDHANADERRDIRTLSGGEIFLASLSLALALADSIAELATVDGPRLESIFLDEGFGTLDVETLDLLASAIEELSATGRLVAIVTHVRELAERMPVRFEVRKGATTSVIERVEA
ncbi:MAG: SMC family ATPase [Actinomycetota bacterium]